MGKKLFILGSLLVLLAGVPVVVHASIFHIFHHHRARRTYSSPSELARAEAGTYTSAYTAGWNNGYRTGYKAGQMDHSQGAKFDADDAPGYKGYRSSYNSSVGKRSRFKKGYRKGFDLGYQDGYSGLVSRLIMPATPAQAQPPYSSEMRPSESQPSTAQEAPIQQEPRAEQEEQAPPAPTNQGAQEEQAYSAPANQQTQVAPSTLPKTASDLPLLGLIGLMSIGLSGVFRSLGSEQVQSK